MLENSTPAQEEMGRRLAKSGFWRAVSEQNQRRQRKRRRLQGMRLQLKKILAESKERQGRAMPVGVVTKATETFISGVGAKIAKTMHPLGGKGYTTIRSEKRAEIGAGIRA